MSTESVTINAPGTSEFTEIKANSENREVVLEVRHLEKYFGRRRVIADASFDVYAGEIFGFLGPNGAGKTTTIKMILGFLFPDSGEIRIMGHNLRTEYEKALACVGGIVENPDMFRDFSGLENLKMYADLHDGVTRERIDEVVRLVGLEKRIRDKVRKYSLGMKQRLGVEAADSRRAHQRSRPGRRQGAPQHAPENGRRRTNRGVRFQPHAR